MIVPSPFGVAAAAFDGVDNPFEIARLEAELYEITKEIADANGVSVAELQAWLETDEGRAWLEEGVSGDAGCG